MKLRLTGLAMKPEVNYGVDSVPTPAANAIQLEEAGGLWNTLEADYLERNERPDLSGHEMGTGPAAQPSGGFMTWSTVTALKGADAAASFPESDAILRSCGLIRADGVPAVGQRTWSAPALNEAPASYTAYVYAGGLLFKALGVRSQLESITWLPGKVPLIRAKHFGLLPADPTQAALPQFTYSQAALKPPIVSSVPLTLNGFAARWHSVTLEMGTEVVALPRGDAAGGHAGYEIVHYDAKLKVTIDNPVLASLNPWSIERLGGTFAWSLDMLGGVAQNRFSVLGPAGQVSKISPGDKDRMTTLGLTISLRRDPAALASPPFRIVQS